VLFEAYGITETSPLCIANPIHRPKTGSIGIPLPDTDARIVDIETGDEVPSGKEGELLIHGPQVMKGYLNKPEATAEATVEATAIIWAVTALDRVMGITWVAMVQALVGSKMQLKGWSHYSTPLFYVLFEKLFIGV